MKQHKHWWEGIGLILGILALILVARTLLNAQPPAASEPAQSTVTATAIPPSATAEATGTPTAVPTQVPATTSTPAEATAIPLCSFAVPTQTEPTSESLLDAYAFSEPRVVLTGESAIEMIEWLPDERYALIVRRVVNQPRHAIEVFDVRTGEVKKYAESAALSTLKGSNNPIWLADKQAVAYVDFDDDGNKVLHIRQSTTALENNVITASPNLAIGGDGNQILYFPAANRGQPYTYALGAAQNRAWIPELQLPVVKATIVDLLMQYKIAVRPQGDQVAYYNNQGFYFADSSTGQICEVNWGELGGRKRWAIEAQWSPDGHYLAAFLVVGDRPFSSNDLVILNTMTGEQYLIDLDMWYYHTMAWAPNNRDALIIAKDFTEGVLHNLFIVDIFTGAYKPILQDYPFRNTGNWGIDWSSQDEIALGCPVLREDRSLEGRLCIIQAGVEQ